MLNPFRINFTKNFYDPCINSNEFLKNSIKKGDLKGVKNSLENGANPNLFIGKKSVLNVACEIGNLSIVRALLDKGANVNSQSGLWNNTPLHRACVFGYEPIVKELIYRKAKVDVRNDNCWHTPLENAISFGHLGCSKLLIEAGANVNAVNNRYGSTPLMEACGNGNQKIVKLLLDSKVNPNLGVGTTPLIKSVKYPEILLLLLQRGAKVDAKDKCSKLSKGNQALHEAVCISSERCVKSVRILLDYGADLRAKNAQNRAPIDLANFLRRNEEDNSRRKNMEKILKIFNHSLMKSNHPNSYCDLLKDL